jgi:DNA polymerase III epsilon subunit-like protein
VKENVLPLLTNQKVSREEVRRQMREFIGDTKPFALAYVDQYDAIYTRKLFAEEDLPFHWISLDFAPMLFLMGISPEIFDKHHKEAFLKEWGFADDAYRNHHALDDARLLRTVYLEFLKRYSD